MQSSRMRTVKMLPYLFQICQLDEEAIRVSALQSLFDIIVVHGMECLQDDNSKHSKTLVQSADGKFGGGGGISTLVGGWWSVFLATEL